MTPGGTSTAWQSSVRNTLVLRGKLDTPTEKPLLEQVLQGTSMARSSLALLSQKDKQCAQNTLLIKPHVCSVKFSLPIPFAVLPTPWILALSALYFALSVTDERL